jgi:hypothetical protein
VSSRILLLLALSSPAWAADGGVWVPFGLEGGFVHVRTHRGGIGLSRGSSTGDSGVVTTERSQAECVALTWRGAATASSLPLSLSADGLVTDVLLLPGPRGWRLNLLAVRQAGSGVELPFACATELQFELDAGTSQVLPTTAGPIFRDRGACAVLAGAGVERTCTNGGCRDAEGHAEPFDLGPCEAALQWGSAALREVLGAAEPRRLATLQRLLETFRTGGVLFELRDELPQCAAWQVRPAGELKAKFSSKVVLEDDRLTRTMDVALLPWSRQLLLGNVMELREGLDGGSLGMSGSGGAQGPLLPADGHVLMGRSWFFFDRAACERFGGHGPSRAGK